MTKPMTMKEYGFSLLTATMLGLGLGACLISCGGQQPKVVFDANYAMPEMKRCVKRAASSGELENVEKLAICFVRSLEAGVVYLPKAQGNSNADNRTRRGN